MKLSEMIADLERLKAEHGDLEVMITTDSGTYSMESTSTEYRCAEDDEYPKEWEMPGGFEFIEILVLD